MRIYIAKYIVENAYIPSWAEIDLRAIWRININGTSKYSTDCLLSFANTLTS